MAPTPAARVSGGRTQQARGSAPKPKRDRSWHELTRAEDREARRPLVGSRRTEREAKKQPFRTRAEAVGVAASTRTPDASETLLRNLVAA